MSIDQGTMAKNQRAVRPRHSRQRRGLLPAPGHVAEYFSCCPGSVLREVGPFHVRGFWSYDLVLRIFLSVLQEIGSRSTGHGLRAESSEACGASRLVILNKLSHYAGSSFGLEFAMCVYSVLIRGSHL